MHNTSSSSASPRCFHILICVLHLYHACPVPRPHRSSRCSCYAMFMFLVSVHSLALFPFSLRDGLMPSQVDREERSRSAPIPPAITVVVVLSLVDALLVVGPRWCRNWRRRGNHFRSAIDFLTLPLQFADALAALATDVFG